MKAKLFILALTAAAFGYAANAQEATQAPARKLTYSSEGSNWFVDAQWGIGITLFGNNRGAQASGALTFAERLNFLNPTLSVGKWFNPFFATRAQLMGFSLYDHTYSKATGANRITNSYVAGHVDVMLDLHNFFMPYKADRFFRIIPFAGMGIGYNFSRVNAAGVDLNKSRFTPLVNVGAQLKFRATEVLDINLEAQGVLSRFHFFGTNNAANKSDVNAFLSAGVTYNICNTPWTEIVPMDYTLAHNLNKQINALRAENEVLGRRPESCPECPELVEGAGVTSYASNVVYFRINSAIIEANQLVNIYNTAEFAKANGGNITLVGYADRNTGKPDYNFRLSERRAKAVADVLIKKYGIEPERIKIEWKGDIEQVYAENDWNRVVIMNTVK